MAEAVRQRPSHLAEAQMLKIVGLVQPQFQNWFRAPWGQKHDPVRQAFIKHYADAILGVNSFGFGVNYVRMV
jgi:hypothetical protein